MDVTIEAIKFNHDPSSADMDALTIRKNEDCEIVLPEWKAGKAVSPAAYVCAPKALTIEIELKRHNPSVKSVDVSAKSKGILNVADNPAVEIENILGHIPVESFHFTSDSLRALVHFTEVRLGEIGVGKWKVTFDWMLKPNVGEVGKLQTEHDVYTVFASPQPPWGRDPEDSQYEYEPPWVDVLEKACEWAVEATDPITAASKITTKLHSLGQLTDPDLAKSKLPHLKFNENRTFSRLALNGTDSFVFSDVLNRLNEGEIITVNCTDCAILVSTFTNILGCGLFQAEMGPAFLTNYIREIGSARKHRTDFKYHEVAWEHPCDSTANLFDCFLELDGDSKPYSLDDDGRPGSGGGFKPLLPVNIPFGNHKSRNYHYRLVQEVSDCEPLKNGIRRKIARNGKKFAVRKLHSKLKEPLTKEFHFAEWEKVGISDRLFPGPLERLAEEFLPAGWKREHSILLQRQDGTDDRVLELSEFVWQSSANAHAVLRILSYRCASVLDARALLLELLGEFQFDGMKPLFDFNKGLPGSVLGDLAFSEPGHEALLFARSNVVVFVQSIGSASFSGLHFARDFDGVVSRALNLDDILKERSDFPLRKVPEQPQSITDIRKETLMSTDFKKTVWSSIRPSTATANPAHMARDGLFKIIEYDKTTGDVRGRYYDLTTLDDVDFTGSIRFVGGTSYSFVFYHKIPGTDDRRVYYGHTVAEDEKVSVIGGRWKKEEPDENSVKNNDVKNGQNEGVWVATKP